MADVWRVVSGGVELRVRVTPRGSRATFADRETLFDGVAPIAEGAAT